MVYGLGLPIKREKINLNIFTWRSCRNLSVIPGLVWLGTTYKWTAVGFCRQLNNQPEACKHVQGIQQWDSVDISTTNQRPVNMYTVHSRQWDSVDSSTANQRPVNMCIVHCTSTVYSTLNNHPKYNLEWLLLFPLNQTTISPNIILNGCYCSYSTTQPSTQI